MSTPRTPVPEVAVIGDSLAEPIPLLAILSEVTRRWDTYCTLVAAPPSGTDLDHPTGNIRL